jgi:hypothetical protein
LILAVELARAVGRGLLSELDALAAIELAAMRAQLPASCTLDDKVRIDRGIFGLHLERHYDLSNNTADDIQRAVRPLIAGQHPRGRIRAEAHEVNAEHAFQLTEPVVELVIIDELQRQRAQKSAATKANTPPYRRRRYG